MILDPTDQFITTILAHCDIRDKVILEVGCGKGRVTRDLARFARKVVATDPDEAALQQARAAITSENVEFVRCRGEALRFPPNSFDVAVYPLSLHHIPSEAMVASLAQAMGCLREGGCVIVIEPGEGGAMNEAKERFGVGSGDEREGKESALKAMAALQGWHMGETVRFRTLFSFADEEDFFHSMLPGYREKPQELLREIALFLGQYREGSEIVLDSERRMNVLTRHR
ncbi:MAG: hypothetical protein FD174_3492 [Geobacteraceae bacterium]|nr:MAG: hypothetical protein FD174_3492 [Geobacteraceae bacterium]